MIERVLVISSILRHGGIRDIVWGLLITPKGTYLADKIAISTKIWEISTLLSGYDYLIVVFVTLFVPTMF